MGLYNKVITNQPEQSGSGLLNRARSVQDASPHREQRPRSEDEPADAASVEELSEEKKKH
jgi:hypothetical protein